jgi:hypothetical protein
VPIAGDRPETGVRIAIERDASRDDPPWDYAGAVHLPAVSFPLRVRVDDAGTVTVTIAREAGVIVEPPEDLAEKVRLIVRTVYRQARADDEAPAWRIVRWRGEK